tara:strand:+ start:4481 stop:4723 length:243 start_codon:yes stop_codon:yes gene_type:complete
MRFHEVSKQAEEAARLGRWMMDQTYRIKENHELANRLSKIGEMLCHFDMPHGTRWTDFSAGDKKLINECKQFMEKDNART